jgi:predicted MFS family arabinose efflux permease
VGFVIAGRASSFTTFCVAHGLLIGLLGSSATFGPMMADTAQWWTDGAASRWRSARAATSSAGDLAAAHPWGVESWGWRATYVGVGVASGIASSRSPRCCDRAPAAAPAQARPGFGTPSETPFGLPSGRALLLLCVASVSCCIAMSMPQVHIVALCVDLGFGPARGAEMLALMLGVRHREPARGRHARRSHRRAARPAAGVGAAGDRAVSFPAGARPGPLYAISALFGFFQGAIVPSYAVVIREYFPPRKTGAQVGAVIMCAMLGMALGGWMSGRLFDLTGSYRVAIFNGIAWNLLNLAIVGTLCCEPARPLPPEFERATAGRGGERRVTALAATGMMCPVETAILPLRTGRLVLEPQVRAHAPEMFRVLSDPAIYEHENEPPSLARMARGALRAPGVAPLAQRRRALAQLGRAHRLGGARGLRAGDGDAALARPHRVCVRELLLGTRARHRGRARGDPRAGDALSRAQRGRGVEARQPRSLRLLERLGFRIASPRQRDGHHLEPASSS